MGKTATPHPALAALCARLPDKKQLAHALWADMAKNAPPLLTINSRMARSLFFDKLYSAIIDERSGGPPQAVDMRGIAVSASAAESVAAYQNKMHACSKCLKNGKSDADARNVATYYRYSRGDEAGHEFLRCQNCGNSWVR